TGAPSHRPAPCHRWQRVALFELSFSSRTRCGLAGSGTHGRPLFLPGHGCLEHSRLPPRPVRSGHPSLERLWSRRRLRREQVMEIHSLAGHPAPPEMLIDVAKLERAYYERRPDFSDPNQRVLVGTSGDRGTAVNGTFAEAHILAI